MAEELTESVDTAAKTLTAHGGKIAPASQAVPALTQMSARAKETVVERVEAIRNELDDRKYTARSLATDERCHLLSRELQACYVEKNRTQPAMKAAAALIESILKILPTCFSHSPSRSGKPDWLFEERWRADGEALEQLLSAIAAGVLDAFISFDVPQQDSPADSARETLDIIKEQFACHALPAFAAVAARDASQKIDPCVRRDYMKILCIAIKGNKRCKKEVMDKNLGIPGIETLLANATDGRILQQTFHILWILFFRVDQAEQDKMGQKIFTRRSVPSEEARKKLKELWTTRNNNNINVLERDEPLFLQVLAGTSLDKAQIIDVQSANFDGKTLDIYSLSKNVMQTRLSVNQRSIDLRVGRHDKLWEVPLAAITRFNLSTGKNDNVQAEIVFNGPPVIDNLLSKNPKEGSHSLVIATTSAGADLLKRALFQRYTPALSDKTAPKSANPDSRSLAPPKASQPAAVDILRSSPTHSDEDVATIGEKAVQAQTVPERREQTVMRDSDTSKDEDSITGNSSGSRKTRASTRQAESAQVEILAGDSHPSSAVGTQKKNVSAAVSQRDRQVMAASSTTAKQQQEKEAIDREAATMDLSVDESELSELDEDDVQLVETSRKKVTVQQTITVEQEKAVVAVKHAKEPEMADRKGKKRGSDALETVHEIEELDEEDVGPSTRSSKKAKLEVIPPPPLKAEKPTSKTTSKATTSDSDSTKTGKGKVSATYGSKNKSRQRGKKGRDSGVGIETDRKNTLDLDDSDGAGTDYDMPGVDKPPRKKEAAKSGKAAAPSKGRDSKGKSAGGHTEKREVAISSSTPKKAKAKPADIKIGGAAKPDKPTPWRKESQSVDASNEPTGPMDAQQETRSRLNAPRTRAQMAPTDSDPIEPNTRERGTSRKPVSAETFRSKKPIQSMAQLCASDDAPARGSEPPVAENSSKAKPALTVTKPEQPALKPISTGSKKSDRSQQPTSARSEEFPMQINVGEALLHSETGDQAVDNAFGDLFDPPDARAASVAASDRTADQIKRYTNLYDDEGETGGAIAVPAINTIAATQDRVHNSLMDVDNAMPVDEAPVAARTRAKTPDLRAKTPELRAGTSPVARTDAVSPQLEAPVDAYAVLSTPASVKAKKELAEIEQELAKPSEPEPTVKQEYVDLDSSSDSDEPMEKSEEVEEAEDDDEDEYLPAPARRAREKSAEKKVVERDPVAKREWEEAVQLHRKQENAKLAEMKASEKRTRRDPPAGVAAEPRRREQTAAAAAAVPEVPAMSTAQRRRAAVREAQNKKAQGSREAAERAADEAIADLHSRRQSAPPLPMPEISFNTQARRAAGRKSEPVPQYRPAEEEARAPARSRRVAALAEENAMPPPRRERSPAIAQPPQLQEEAVPMIQPRKLDNSLLGIMKQLNQVILDGMHQKMDDYGTSRDGSIDAITRVIEAGCEEAQRSDLRLIKARTHSNETIHTVHSNFMVPISQIQEEVSDEKARLAADKLVANELANLLKAKVHLGLFSTMSSLDKVRKRRGVKA